MTHDRRKISALPNRCFAVCDLQVQTRDGSHDRLRRGWGSRACMEVFTACRGFRRALALNACSGTRSGNLVAWLLGVLLACTGVPVHAAGDHIDALRGDYAISDDPPAPRLEEAENRDIKRKRNYPMQPPTIPHKIDGYQVDLNTNKCLSCHSRRRTEESQATMVSVTHYMDRDGNFLGEVSPRRYFCQQCHVTQTVAQPRVGNNFEDVDMMVQKSAGGQTTP